MPVKFDTPTFVRLSRARYPEQFDYREAVYLSAKDKVILYCTLHQPAQRVEITPDHHLHRGSGCRACKSRGLQAHFSKSATAFIDQARAKHGDDFDYTQVDYCNAKTAVQITCRKHGQTFMQSPEVHLRGAGCATCGKDKLRAANADLYARRRVGWSDFLQRAQAKHPGRYTYQPDSYTGLGNKVRVICKTHGVFTPRASRHLAGQGCPGCTKAVAGLALEAFEQRIEARYDGRYRHELLGEYQGVLTPLRVTCPDHAQTWETTVQGYLVRAYCAPCRRESRRAKVLANQRRADPLLDHALAAVALTQPALSDPEDLRFALFVQRARERHGQRYCYVREGYNYDYRRVTIQCDRHPPFRLIAARHLEGDGCPFCAMEAQVLAEAGERFGPQRFDYCELRLQSLNRNTRVRIGCRRHQVWFEQSLALHLDGFNGCKACARDKHEQTLAQKAGPMRGVFLARAEQLHHGAYVYPHLDREFEFMSSKITIYCPAHQFTFTQPAQTHVSKEAPGCQRCKGDAARKRHRLPYTELQARISQNGFTLLTPELEYASASHKVKVRCANNHVLSMQAQKIFAGQSCARCSGYVGETIAMELLRELFAVDFPKRRLTEHVGPYAWLELDGYSVELGIGAEYQGAPHHLRRFHKTDKAYEDQQARDKQTRVMCEQAKIRLVEIKEFAYPFNDANIRERLEEALLAAGCKPAQAWPEPLDHRRFLQHVSGRGLQSLATLALLQHLKCLDDSWFGDWYSYRWRCLACAHEFNAPYATRRDSKWQCCPRCARRRPDVAAQRQQTQQRQAPVYLENLRQRAAGLGLELLDTQWRGAASTQTYSFRCVYSQQPVAPRTYNHLLKKVLGCRCEPHRQLLARLKAPGRA